MLSPRTSKKKKMEHGSPRSRSSCSTNISIRPTLEIVRAFERRFHGFTLKYIPRAENVEVDELAKATANNIPMPSSKNSNYQQQQ
jgi:hypothetical protein